LLSLSLPYRCEGETRVVLRDGNVRFCGEEIDAEALSLIGEVVASCGGLSRMELAHTVCELLGWQRASGGLKARECREFLEALEARGVLELPARRPGRPRGSRTRVPQTTRGEPGAPLVAEVGDLAPITVELVEKLEQRELFRELVGRHHYLGHKVPFGAQLRYLVFAARPERGVLGCLQFSSPAWRIAVRDRWIGWDEATRRRNLQRVVSNSRFLVLPWVRVRNLASTVLALATRRLAQDWERRYGVRPVLVETMVDGSRYHGGCYRAANWIVLGTTAGLGRTARPGDPGLTPKTVLVYPLVPDALRRLREG
jgi:hypothetical protein